jgi:hypothetical protein
MPDQLPKSVRILAGLLSPLFFLAGLPLVLLPIFGMVSGEVSGTQDLLLGAAAVLAGVATLKAVSLLGQAQKGEPLTKGGTAIVVLGALVSALVFLRVVTIVTGISEDARVHGMESALLDLRGPQQAHFDAHQRYSQDLSALGHQPSPYVQVVIEWADSTGWRATAGHVDSRTTCSITIRNDATVTPPRGGLECERK